MSDSKYTPDMPERLLAIMSEGKSIKQAAKELGVCRETINEWAHQYPEFMAAKNKGKEYAEAYWEDIGQKGAKGVLAKFNAPAWMYYMKCRFKEEWVESNNQKIELVDGVKRMTNDELDKTIQTILSQKSKNTVV